MKPRERLRYRAEFDFADGNADFKDVFVSVKDIPAIGYFRIGHFKEPQGLEQLESSNHIPFIERSFASILNADRNTGLEIRGQNNDQSLTWDLGLYHDTDSFGNATSGTGAYSVAGRITGLPLYRDSGRNLLHLGASYSHRNLAGDKLRIRTVPEAEGAPKVLDTGLFDADNMGVLGLEFNWTYQAFAIQSEYLTARVNGVDSLGGLDRTFHGYYLQGSYFFTGEHRPYNKTWANFKYATPNKSVWDGGVGAWQLALRYSWLDLDDQDVRGGNGESFTGALNWYLDSQTRVMLDYTNFHLKSVGDSDQVLMRVSVFW